MAHLTIVSFNNTFGVYSFTTGFIASPPQKARTEKEIFLHALWLERHGREEEGWTLLERYCAKT